MGGKKAEAVTTVERVSDRELVVTRVVNAPARLVFQAWTTADLMKRWWVPASFGLTLMSIEMDVRTGASTVWSLPIPPHPRAWRFSAPTAR